MEITRLNPDARAQVTSHVLAEWGDPVISKGEAVDVRTLPGFAAEAEGKLAGALLYRVQDDACEIVVLYALLQGQGIGAALVQTAIAEAKAQGCHRIWLITTNDNTHALRFYQRLGFDLAALHLHAFEVTKQMKKMPLAGEVLGMDGIPIRHELELEMRLPQSNK